MWLHTAALVSILPFFGHLVYAFDAKKDSCQPQGAFSYISSPNLVVCENSHGHDRSAVFLCDENRRVRYDPVSNSVETVVQSSPNDGDFTIHIKCFYKNEQVAHFDLYTPVNKNVYKDSVWAGLNRLCNLRDKDTVMRVYSYSLTQQQLTTCGHHPVTPKRG